MTFCRRGGAHAPCPQIRADGRRARKIAAPGSLFSGFVSLFKGAAAPLPQSLSRPLFAGKHEADARAGQYGQPCREGNRRDGAAATASAAVDVAARRVLRRLGVQRQVGRVVAVESGELLRESGVEIPAVKGVAFLFVGLCLFGTAHGVGACEQLFFAVVIGNGVFGLAGVDDDAAAVVDGNGIIAAAVFERELRDLVIIHVVEFAAFEHGDREGNGMPALAYLGAGGVRLPVELDARDGDGAFVIIETDGVAVFRRNGELLHVCVIGLYVAVQLPFSPVDPIDVCGDRDARVERDVHRFGKDVVHDVVYRVHVGDEKVERFGIERGDAVDIIAFIRRGFALIELLRIGGGEGAVEHLAVFDVDGGIPFLRAAVDVALRADGEGIVFRLFGHLDVLHRPGRFQFAVDVDVDGIGFRVCGDEQRRPFVGVPGNDDGVLFHPGLLFGVVGAFGVIEMIDLYFDAVFPGGDLEGVVVFAAGEHIVVADHVHVVAAEGDLDGERAGDQVGEVIGARAQPGRVQVRADVGRKLPVLSAVGNELRVFAAVGVRLLGEAGDQLFRCGIGILPDDGREVEVAHRVFAHVVGIFKLVPYERIDLGRGCGSRRARHRRGDDAEAEQQRRKGGEHIIDLFKSSHDFLLFKKRCLLSAPFRTRRTRCIRRSCPGRCSLLYTL